jgi:hypothetical protein
VADSGTDPCRKAFGISGAGDALELDSGSHDLSPGATSGADLPAAGDATLNQFQAEMHCGLALHPGQLLLKAAQWVALPVFLD